MSIDALLDQVYDRKTNNCLHFAASAWQHLMGDNRLHSIREANVLGVKSVMRQFQKVAGPTVAPSVVLMESASGDVHIGVCMRRRLLHLCERGAEFMPFECYAGVYHGMRFYQ